MLCIDPSLHQRTFRVRRIKGLVGQKFAKFVEWDVSLYTPLGRRIDISLIKSIGRYQIDRLIQSHEIAAIGVNQSFDVVDHGCKLLKRSAGWMAVPRHEALSSSVNSPQRSLCGGH